MFLEVGGQEVESLEGVGRVSCLALRKVGGASPPKVAIADGSQAGYEGIVRQDFDKGNLLSEGCLALVRYDKTTGIGFMILTDLAVGD